MNAFTSSLACLGGNDARLRAYGERSTRGRGDSPVVFACALGQVDGVSGCTHHRVPVALDWPRDTWARVELSAAAGAC